MSTYNVKIKKYSMDNKQQQIIVKSNAVIEASYSLDSIEYNVLHACIAQIDSTNGVWDKTKFVLHATDYAVLTGTSKNEAYARLKEAASRLFERKVYIRDDNPKRLNDYLVTRWVSGIRYIASTGTISLTFAPDILPYLSQIKSNFTQYELQNVSKMRSIYAIRLYEWLMQWRTSQRLDVSLDDYRHRLQIVDKYPSIKDLKLYTLKPAIKSINDTSDIMVEWNQKKSGRMVTNFVFNWDYKNKKTRKKISKKWTTPESYAALYPEKTKGKTRDEVVKMMKNET